MNLVLFDSCCRQHLAQVLRLCLAVAVEDGFFGGESQHFAFDGDALDFDVGVHHGLGDVGTAVAGLGGGAHKRAHVALVFVGLHLAVLVHHGGGADARARVHIDTFASY